MNPPAILNPNDSSYLTEFFQNPNGILTSDSIDWVANQPNMKPDGSGLGRLPDFDPSSQGTHGPSFALGHQTEPEQSSLTHSYLQNQQHMPTTPHMSRYNEHDNNASSYETVNAAYNLHHMQMVSRQHESHSQSSAGHMNGLVGGRNWSGIEGAHQIGGGVHGQQGEQVILRSPLTSSGRQSSNSYHGQQQLSHPLQPGYLSEQHWSESLHNTHPPVMHPQQHARQQSIQGYNMFPGQPVHGTQPMQLRDHHMQSHAMGFGSDLNFSGGHYQAPSSQFAREDEKGANLNQVPFADELTTRGRPQLPHAHPFTSQQLSRSGPVQNLPFPTGFSNTLAPPNQQGGLPNATPTNPYSNNYTTGAMHTHSTGSPESSDDDDDVEINDSRTGKRRKSARDDGDDEYDPTSRGGKKSTSRRGSKVAKVDTSAGDEIAVQPAARATSTKPSTKRRRVSASNRSSPGSQDYTTPRNTQSETPETETKSSTKKKNRASQPRNNLTEEEKRQNHIKSEKVRRDLIKAQYDALDSLVPGLKNGKSGLSRADVLLEIVNFVENVARGNDRAEAMLTAWDASVGTSSGDG